MYNGIIVENSLTDLSCLKALNIMNTWQDGTWILHKVEITEAQIEQLAVCIKDGPWYTHFWDTAKENIIVVFKNKTFLIRAHDHRTWEDAVVYGRNLGIPLEQDLGFPHRSAQASLPYRGSPLT
jgi:hypothetical protein